jgi:hypothetical protein
MEMRLMAQPGAAEKRETVDSTRERELEKQHQDAIENLAHRLWIERGCPNGSAEIDWLEAEEKLAPRLIPSARG